MHQHAPSLPILAIPQRLLDPPPRPLELPQQILIVDIIHRDFEMLVPLPILEVLEVVLEDRDNVGDA